MNILKLMWQLIRGFPDSLHFRCSECIYSVNEAEFLLVTNKNLKQCKKWELQDESKDLSLGQLIFLWCHSLFLLTPPEQFFDLL